MDEGLCTEDLMKAARRGFRAVRQKHSVSLGIRQPFSERAFKSVDEFAVSLMTLVQSPRASVIINMGTPRYNHWTVVRGLRGASLLLRDSSTLKQLDLRRYDVNTGRYRLRSEETLLVQLKTQSS